ncbi:hypothetical protein AAG906_027670 [Vitis piasezkii]
MISLPLIPSGNREVLNVRGGGELAAWSNVVGHPAFKDDGTKLSSGGVDGGSVSCKTAANDAKKDAQQQTY